jgi:virginiamycin B lyase
MRAATAIWATWFVLPGAAAAVTQTPTPTQPSNPVGIVEGSDGALWFTEPGADRIGRLTTSGQFSEFPIPTANADPEQITRGSDGALWFTETAANQIGRIPTNATPGSGAQITQFPVPTSNSRPLGIAAGSDGALWFTESNANQIGRIPTNATPGTGAQITEFPITMTAIDTGPVGIASGSDGALWFTEAAVDAIARIPTTATPIVTGIQTYPLPATGAGLGQITSGPDGALWFTENSASKIGRIPPDAAPGSSAQVTEYRTPSIGPLGIAAASIGVDSQGPIPGLWLTEQGGEFNASEVTAFDPATRAFSSNPLSAGDVPAAVVGGPDGAVWFTNRSHSEIGRIPAPALGGTPSPTEGVTFTDPVATVFGRPTSASISWGDGTTTAGAITADGATSAVFGIHAYAEEGSTTAIVTAYYCAPPVQSCGRSVDATVRTGDAPLTATAADDPEPTIRQRFTATLATFTDPDQNAAATDYSATINWGDGSTSAADSIVAADGGFDVVGSHTYHRYGAKNATVTISDAGGAQTSTDVTITPQFPTPPKCDPSECPKGNPPPQGIPCPPGDYGLEPNCSPPTPSDCFAPSPVAAQNWLEGNPDIDPENGHIISQALEFGNLVLVATGDCWHYDGNSAQGGGPGSPPATGDRANAVCRPPTCTGGSPVYGFFHTRGTVFVNGIAVQNECATIRVSTTGSISADPYPGGCRTLVARYNSTTLDRATGHLPVGECGGVECADRGQFQGFVADAHLDSSPWVVEGAHLADLTGDLPEGAGNGVGGFPLTGTITITVTGKGLAHIDGNVQLPGAFSTDRNGAGQPPSSPIGLDQGFVETGSGPFAGDTVLARTAGTIPPLQYDDVWLGGLEIRNVSFMYDDSSRIWSASGDLYLVGVELAGGQFQWGPDGFIEGSVAKQFIPPLPIATDVALSQIELKMEVGPPTKISGSVSLEAGNGIATLDGGGFVVFATSAHDYSYQPNDIPGIGQLAIPHGPFSDTVIGLGGTVTVNVPIVNFSFPLASAYVLYSPGFFEFAGGVHFDFGPLTVDGGIAGAIGHLVTGGTGFDLEGFVHACVGWSSLSLCGDIDGIVSSIGAQVCFGDQGGEIYWSKGYPQPIFWDCDITGFRPPFGAADSASAARTFTLKPGLPAAEVELVGQRGPPDVTLTSPAGRTIPITFSAHHPTGRDAVLGAQLPAQSQTYLGIKQPDPGRWTVTPAPNSPPLTALLVADGLPPAQIRVSVSGTGYRRTLHYAIRPRADERIVFVERGRQSYQVLGVAREGRGSLQFTPALGPPGLRHIVAVVELGGLPTRNLTVASYGAPGSPVPPRPLGLHVSLRRSVLTASWRAVSHATGYQVTVRSTDGRNRGFVRAPSPRSLRLAGYRGVGVTVTVAGLGPAGDQGPPAAGSIAPPRALPAVRGLAVTQRRRLVEVHWRRVAGAARYRVTLTVGTGRRTRRLAFDVARTAVAIRGLRRGVSVLVAIRGETAAFALGAPSSKRFTTV